MLVTLSINGEKHEADVEPRLLLVHLIRDVLRLTGTHIGCDTTHCGACTVLLDGQPVCSCLLLAVKAQGREVVTIEGLGEPERLHPVQAAFVEYGALQCGFCGPGMILSAAALLARSPHPVEGEVREAIAGNLCRCTGYAKIVQAILAASGAGAREGTE